LHDPIEDNAGYDWNDYRTNYLKTVTASLLHPDIHTYEICPWPNRVYRRAYPSDSMTGKPAKDAKFIPAEYAGVLNGLVQTFGNMQQDNVLFEGNEEGIGVFMSDTGLYQRSFPDGVHRPQEETIGNMQRFLSESSKEKHRDFFEKIEGNKDSMLAFIASGTFPQFFGLTLPLLKYGLAVRPLLLDNLRRYPGYLAAYRRLVLSYEYMKPESPDINNVIAQWVVSGGTLFYVGDGSDPYHGIDSWWTAGGYDNPAQHLFEMLGLSRTLKDGTYPVGKGNFVFLSASPASFCLSAKNAGAYREWIKKQMAAEGAKWDYSNRLVLRRGPYVIAAVMDESVCDDALTLKGSFADAFTHDFALISEKTVKPGENTLLYDLGFCREDLCVIGSAARIFELGEENGKRKLRCRAAADVAASIRIYCKKPWKESGAVDSDGKTVDIKTSWDEKTSTVLLTFTGNAKDISIRER
jgi:hypothetical protein